MKHKMEKTPRIITKIGLVLEFLNVFFGGVFVYFFDRIFSEAFLLRLDPETTQEELDFLFTYLPIFRVIIFAALIFSTILLIVNYILFSGLYKEQYEENKAIKVYTYQFIIGIVYLFSNLVVGILYVISGSQGRQGDLDMPDIREGI